jgi:alanine-glyoxylate transaminase/serine-glyoxylate transaminase/serine-pyruvate transaminase
MSYLSGRHFLQIPGPSNVPDRILRAMDRPTIDHRSAEFSELGKACLDGMKHVFRTQHPVLIFPSSSTGAWEAALVNTLSPGDRVLAFETGHFATLWSKVAGNLGLRVDFVSGDWRHGIDADLVLSKLREDAGHEIRAVLAVHNETSTGVTSDVAAVRRAMDEARHPALLMVDAVSSLGSIDYRHDEWRVDVAVSGSQKGLMLPPGLSFNAVSPKALEAAKQARLAKSYWRWDAMLENNAKGFFPYTPATNLLYGLREALSMLREEGLANVFARHDRLAEAARRAVNAWGLEIWASNPAEYSNTVTGVGVPEGFSESAFRELLLKRFNLSLGSALGKIAGKMFRIGHLGDFNELMLAGTLAGVEMGLELTAIPHRKGGIVAALDYLTGAASSAATGSSKV